MKAINNLEAGIEIVKKRFKKIWNQEKIDMLEQELQNINRKNLFASNNGLSQVEPDYQL